MGILDPPSYRKPSGGIPSGDLASGVLPAYPNNSGNATVVSRPGVVDIRDYIISGTIFNLSAVIAAMEAMNGYCYIPAGNWTPSTFNVALDSNISDNTGTAKSRFTYKFLGSGKSSRLLLPSGMNSGDYLLVANAANINDFTTNAKIIFEDIAVSGPASPNGSFFKSNQRSFTARRVYFSSLMNGFYATGYCDSVRLEQVQAEAMTAGSWIYTGVNNGDGLVVDQMMAYATGGINLTGCLGATVRGCISGWHQFRSCSVTLEENHFEGDGTTNATPVITLQGCTASIRSGFYQAKKYRPTFAIDDIGASLVSRVVFHENVRFAQRLDDPSSELGAAKNVDVDIISMSKQSEVTFKSVRSYAFGQSTAKSSGGGTTLLLAPSVTASGVSQIQTILTQTPLRTANDFTIRYGGSWEIVPTRPNHMSIPTKAIVTPFVSAQATTSPYFTTDMATGTYYYKAWVKEITNRTTGSNGEFNVTLTSTNPLALLTFNTYESPVQLRILRGTTSGTYTQWAQLFLSKEAQAVYDQGSYIGGAQWQNWSGSPVAPGASTYGETANGVVYLESSNAEIRASAAPTVGNWLVGDRCWNSSPSAGGVPGWVCTTSGYPGTWKAMAVMAS